AQVAVLDRHTGTQKVLIRGGSHAHYVPSGHLVYAAGGSLQAVGFDLGRLAITTAPVSVIPKIVTKPQGAVDLAVGSDGTMVYIPGGITGLDRTLVWVDRQGKETPVAAPPRGYNYPRLSPDGSRAALWINDQQVDIWTWDFMRSTLTRFTFDPAYDNYPVWAPDGRRLYFTSQRAGPPNLYVQAADG